MIEKGIFALLFLVIIPELLGLIITKFMNKEKNNLILAFILGYLMEFGICQLITVPLIFKEASFTTLLEIYIIINIILALLSILLNIKRVKELFFDVLKYIKEVPKLLIFMTIILIGIQTYGLVGYMHLDDDDAFYVGTAVTAIETNTIYKYSPTTGALSGEHMDLRYRLGPFPMYYAVISEIIDIHPTILAHTILPIIFIPLCYMVIGILGSLLFKNNKEQTLWFVIIIGFLSMWGNYSVRNNFSFLLFRVWQGKSVLANIIIPSVWMLYLIGKENEFKLINYVSLFILILAGCLTTTMGIALPTISLMLIALADEFSKIKFKELKQKNNSKSKNEKIKIKDCINIKGCFLNITKCLICCIPAIVYGLIYFI